MKKQNRPHQGLYVGHTRAKSSSDIARTVLAVQIIEPHPFIPREKRNETQKILYVACISFFVLFACTVFDFIAFRS